MSLFEDAKIMGKALHEIRLISTIIQQPEIKGIKKLRVVFNFNGKITVTIRLRSCIELCNNILRFSTLCKEAY